MCSHMLVAWMTAALPDGTTVGWWACRDCGHRFEPEPGNLEECRDEMVLEIDRLRAQLAKLVEAARAAQRKIYLALCDEDADYSDWCSEVLPLIHDNLRAVLDEIERLDVEDKEKP